MNEEELKEKVKSAMSLWLEAHIANYPAALGSFNDPNWLNNYHEFIKSASIEWDRILNVLGVRRIEDHLGIPHRKGYIRFRDPFVLGRNSKRDLEMSPDQATKILVLKMPSSK